MLPKMEKGIHVTTSHSNAFYRQHIIKIRKTRKLVGHIAFSAAQIIETFFHIFQQCILRNAILS